MKVLNNLPKLVAIMYIFILFKNILQLIFGYLFSTETDIKFYKIYNIQRTVYSLDFVILLMLIYECFLYVLIYLLIFLMLYFITKRYGNKPWIHIGYFIILYSLVILMTKDDFSIFYLIIMIIAGILNWLLFKKNIK